VDDDLGRDEDGQGDEEPDVRLDVLEEGNRDRAAPGMARERRQQQQGDPGDAGQDQDAPAQQLQRISGEMGPPEQLVQRTAEHQGEVGRFVRDRGLGHGRSDLSRQGSPGVGYVKLDLGPLGGVYAASQALRIRRSMAG
jgi:hypothetical protein